MKEHQLIQILQLPFSPLLSLMFSYFALLIKHRFLIQSKFHSDRAQSSVATATQNFLKQMTTRSTNHLKLETEKILQNTLSAKSDTSNTSMDIPYHSIQKHLNWKEEKCCAAGVLSSARSKAFSEKCWHFQLTINVLLDMWPKVGEVALFDFYILEKNRPYRPSHVKKLKICF